MLAQLKNLDAALERLSFDRKKQLSFLEDFSSLIEDGMPAQQAIAVIQQTAKGGIKRAAESIQNQIAQGKQLATGMEGWFTATTVEIIRAGEEGGLLKTSLQTAIALLSQHTSATSGVINSVAYPCIVVTLGLGVAVFLKHTILSSFASIKPVHLWPKNGQILYYTATIIQDFWWLAILIIIATIVVLMYLFREVTGPIRTTLDILPPFSLYRKIMAARFMETLGTLVSNGITFKDALNTIRRHGNHYLRWHIHNMQIKLSSGRDNIAEVLDTKLISPEEITRLRIIAQGKNFEPALVRLGDHAAINNLKLITLTGKIAGGVLLFIGAVWTIFMIFSIYGVGTFIAT